ncbi:MAG TPA: CAP domain-containing protein [Polyangiaceae bacterium]|nr:CAP domain-containing protein [Polyangiaceae bacterium]
MRGSVARQYRVRQLSRALGALLGLGALSLAALGCSDDAELTTEFPSDSEGAPQGAGSSARPSGAASSAGNPATEAARNSGETPLPSPGRDETRGPIELGGAAGPELTLQTLDVPDGDYCAAVADWDPEWIQFEEEVLLLVNEARSRPADCGSEGRFAPAAPVVMNTVLRCSARLHSLDMFERHYFGHTNPDGLDPFERMAAAGFRGAGAGENIAAGQTSPEQVMHSWMESDGHCANVMRQKFALIGVGYHPGAGRRGLGSNFWTQNFGAPDAHGCTSNCR